jgi:CspA family cold shock protein
MVMLDNIAINSEIEITGQVKWFDIKKGYGFVNSQYGSIFIHRKHLLNDFPAFKDDLIEGTTVNLIAFGTRKGIQCKQIISIDESTSIIPAIPMPQPVVTAIDTNWYFGYIKWYNDIRGFGFVAFESSIHKTDALLHAEIVKSAKITRLDTGQPVYIKIGVCRLGIRVTEIRTKTQMLVMEIN